MAFRLLTEPEGYQLINDYGIPVPPFRIAHSMEEAAEGARDIGYPVVMKVISSSIVHKTESGGIVTGISSDQQAREAYPLILERVRNRMQDVTINGVIVEKEMPAGLEMIVGGRTDPSFGKVITVGFGGIYVELLNDVSTRVLPLTDNELKGMIQQLRGYRLIRGFRNLPEMDEKTFIRILDQAGRMFSGEVQMVEFDLNPIILYPDGVCAVDARIYVSDQPPMQERQRTKAIDPAIFSPESIAVIGASSDPRKVGYAVVRNLLPFPGSLYPVNPHQAEILARKVFPSVSDIPGNVDLVVIAVPAAQVPGIMEEIGRKGVRLAIIISSGFRETGEQGLAREEEILRIADTYNIRIMGPNCLGIILPARGINTTFDPVSPKPGHIGFVSQSGAMITTVMDWSLTEEIGFSAVISIGNQIDLGFVEFIQFLAHDPDTRAIILYIEEIRNGGEFLSVVRDLAIKKPIIALKSGSSHIGKKAASSHTGSLAGSYEIYQAAFRQAGVIAAYSITETFDIAELLVSEGYPKGRRAIVITAAGGFAVLASDYAEEYGINLVDLPAAILDDLNTFLPSIWSHENPLDIIGDGGAERYARVFDVMIRNQDFWDIAFIIGVPSAVLDSGHLAQEICRFSRHTHKMIVGCLLGGDSMKSGMRILQQKGVPNYGDIQAAFRAVGRTLTGIESIRADTGGIFPFREDRC
jgi:acetyl coenzyme A synthetase (ADP forming)-like protein